MKKGLLKFYKTRFFPLVKKPFQTYRYEVLVGFGGNKGKVVENFKKVLRFWLNDRRLQVVQSSPILKNPPFGYLKQPNFFNALVLVKTSLSPKAFLRFLLHTEKRFKRTREFKNAPRTLDLDILMFEGYEKNDKFLCIPHPAWRHRISVLAPLMWMKNR